MAREEISRRSMAFLFGDDKDYVHPTGHGPKVTSIVFGRNLFAIYLPLFSMSKITHSQASATSVLSRNHASYREFLTL